MTQVSIVGDCGCGGDCEVTTILADTNEVVEVLIPGPAGPAGSSTSTSIVVTSDYTVLRTDDFVVANSATPISITLLDPAANNNKEYNFINQNVGPMTLVGTISGNVNFVIDRQWDSVSIKSIGGQWLVW